MKTNTQWQRMELSADTAKYLRGSHTAWSRIADGEHIFVVYPNNETPTPTSGGYFSLGCRPPGVSLEQWQQAQPAAQPQGERVPIVDDDNYSRIDELEEIRQCNIRASEQFGKLSLPEPQSRA